MGQHPEKKGTVLITGGFGFVGLHLADMFAQEDFKIRTFSRSPRPPHLSFVVDHIQGSVTDKASWLRALESVEYVIHLAVYAGYYPDYSTYLMVNAASTALMYEVIAEHQLPIKKVILASSQAVYGEGKYRCGEHGIFYPERRKREDLQRGIWDISCPVCGIVAEVMASEEDDKLNAVSMYGVSKIAADHTARLLGYCHGIPTAVVRSSHVIGAHPLMTFLYTGSLPSFAQAALSGKPIVIPEDGNQWRNLIHIKDLGRAYQLLLHHTFTGCLTLNAGGAKIRLNDLARNISTAAGVAHSPVYETQLKPWAYRHWVISCEKITQELAWQPVHSVEEGIAEYLALAKTLG